ncbi:nuclear transport factor 2 family protein [Fluviicola chungangensis]|uniref:Nuclear transport factor 2 family protein n=1 Tax=Fluviicola chungangensis TaxID=2597671 RepID=A0A556MQY8_9FLAO|nr:nuclear transport factor 2 family protein [Fluviicola chungangensis]TSJ42333.1 nuclear transport factor 2 family protein [Fluviicola chungangensis]
MKHLFIFCFIAISWLARAQVESNSILYKTILSKDSLLFNIGFNTCDISQFEALLSEQFEFFHDKSGISDRKKFLSDLKNGLCKSPETYQSRRELITEKTQVFPLYENGELYGAIQYGEHRFYEKMEGKAEQFASTAKFTHVWIIENGKWKLRSGLSYDHQK